jgi:hypothetical protein
MNFKYWLLSEEEKIAKVKSLDPNSIRYKKNAQQLIALGNHFKNNDNTEPHHRSPLGEFLIDKRRAFQDSENIKIDPDHTRTSKRKWYDTDKLFGIQAGLPNDWHLDTGKYTPERQDFKILKQKNDQNLIALGNHFKNNDNTEPLTKSPLGIFLDGKRHAFQDSEKIKKKPNYIKTSNRTGYKWYDTDKLFGIQAGLPNDWYLFTNKYKPEKPESKILKQKNDQQLIALGNHFKNNDNTEPYLSSPLGKFLNGKRHAFQDSENIKIDPDHMRTSKRKWYDTDPQVAKDAGLPNDWHLFTDKYKPERKNIESEIYQQTNDQNLKKLGIYFNDKKKNPDKEEPPSTHTLGRFLYNKRRAYEDFTNNTNPTTGKWYKTDLQVAEDAGLPEGWHLFTDKENISQGEKLVGKTLKKLKLDAIHQYRDKECNIITGQCLRFDYSFIYKDQEYFVEYHGEQHYYPVYFGSGEEMTKQEIAEQALEAFEIQKKNDLKKYNYCKERNNNFPLLVIPYWITPDRFKNRILDFIKHDNVFDTLFANSNVPPEYKVKHDKIFYKTECFATNGFGGTVDCEELDVKLTFEQFLINKNFINI